MDNRSGRLVYMNGAFVPERDASISIFDSALMFGDTVFEMTRSFNGKQFKLREHLERLYAGIKILRIPIAMTIDEMEEACYETIETNKQFFLPTDEHRLMINVSRGVLGIYEPIFGKKSGCTIVIADFPLKFTVASMGHLYDCGINAVIPSQRTIPAQYLDPKIKNRSRIHYQMANIEVSEVKDDNNRNWALLLDDKGFVSEGTGDNFFIVTNGEVVSPHGENILRGISRAYVYELCKELEIPCRQDNMEPYDVHTADEAFMTATPFCILPVSSLNGLVIGDGKPMGEITRRLLEKWSKNVGVDIIQQIKDYGKEVGAITGTTPYQFKK